MTPAQQPLHLNISTKCNKIVIKKTIGVLVIKKALSAAIYFFTLFASLEASQKYTAVEVPIFYDYFMIFTTSIGGHALKDDGSVIGEGACMKYTDPMFNDTFCWNQDSGRFSLNEMLHSSALKTSYVSSMNQHGQVIGTLEKEGNYAEVPFFWCPIEGLQIIDLKGFQPLMMNNSGQVILTHCDQFFLWDKKQGAIKITWPSDWGFASPLSLNDNGQILFIDGYSYENHPSSKTVSEFIWENGLEPRIIKSEGMNISFNCINNRGDAAGISGYFSLKKGTQKGYIQLNDGQTFTVGSKDSLVWFHSINDQRQIVGQCYGKKNSAIIWDLEEGMLDLNDLIIGKRPPYHLTEAISINNQGQILAMHASKFGMGSLLILLTPVQSIEN